MIQLGLAHQSNGQSEPLSRSWNRVYLGAGLGHGDFALLARINRRLHERSNDDNPDLTDYIGRGEVMMAWLPGRSTLALTLRSNLNLTRRGSLQLDWTHPVFADQPSGLRWYARASPLARCRTMRLVPICSRDFLYYQGWRRSTMDDKQKELTELYHGLSDEYLVAKLKSGQLTELAGSVARMELSRRGVDSPEPVLPVEVETADDDAVDFVTVARYFVPTEAYILCGRLEAEGIPAVVADANLVQANNLISVAVGGVRVQVPVEFAPEAEGIVAAIQRGEFLLPDGTDL